MRWKSDRGQNRGSYSLLKYSNNGDAVSKIYCSNDDLIIIALAFFCVQEQHAGTSVKCVHCTLHRLYIDRGHSRNWPKGGRNSSQRYTSSRCADHFSQFLLTEFRSLFLLQRTSPALFCTKLCVIHCVRLIWFFCQKVLFVHVKGWSCDHRDP